MGTLSNFESIQLHGFCDASSKAFAAVIYLRLQTTKRVSVSLLIAKSRIAPLKTLTIPRLELCSAVLLAKLMSFVLKHLLASFPSIDLCCWSDSMVTLEWLKHSPARWKVFVAHRVSEIQTLFPNAKWRHVPTQSNPADCASRGLSPNELLLHTTWWSGPEWLTESSAFWPAALQTAPPSDSLEENKMFLINAVTVTEPWNLAKRFSSWFKLLRVTAYIYRFIDKCRKIPLIPPATRELTVVELTRAQTFWIKYIQQELFSLEISEITGPVTKENSLASLSPFLDADGILRIKGRLVHSQLKPAEKHPIILKSHPLVRLLVSDTHKRLLHCGPLLLLSELRKDFWILRARSLLRSEIHGCVVCTRHRAQLAHQ